MMMRRLLRTLPPRAAVRRLSNKSAPPRRAAVVRRLSDGKSLEDLVRNKTAAAVAANQPPPQQTAEAPKTAIVPPDVAHDLCHEVGWESRHSFVDVRGTEAFARGRPKGAINAPYVDGTLDADAIPAEPGRLVVGGGSTKSVAAAADVLRARGFDVIAMDGGFDAWRGLGLPVEVDGVVDDEDDDDGDPATWN
jgi:rhodanese-related sulfurtransferase